MEIPTIEIPEDNPAEAMLAELHALVIRHPVAAQALFRALVHEGKAFARTDEGQAWAQRLGRSDLVRQGRVVWDAVSLNALDDRDEVVVPTAILDAFAKAIATSDLHALLARVLDQSLLGGADAR